MRIFIGGIILLIFTFNLRASEKSNLTNKHSLTSSINLTTDTDAPNSKSCTDKIGHYKVPDPEKKWESIDTQNFVPTVKLYFIDSDDETEIIRGVFREALARNLEPISSQGSASYKPWGAKEGCTGKAVHFNSEKLKTCNDELAMLRAENAVTAAKDVYGSESKINIALSGSANATQGCNFYDEAVDAYPMSAIKPNGKLDPYLKFQNVILKFQELTLPPCMPTITKVLIGGKDFAGSLGGKCGITNGELNVCSGKGGSLLKLKDGTKCTEFFRLKSDLTIHLDALWVPDYFNFIQFDKVKCTTAKSYPVGFISRLHGEDGEKKFKEHYLAPRPNIQDFSANYNSSDHSAVCKVDLTLEDGTIKCYSEPWTKSTSEVYPHLCFFADKGKRSNSNCYQPKFKTHDLNIVSKLSEPIYFLKTIEGLELGNLSYVYQIGGSPNSDGSAHYINTNISNPTSKNIGMDDFIVFIKSNIKNLNPSVKDKLTELLKKKLNVDSVQGNLSQKEKQEIVDNQFATFEEFKKNFETKTGESWSVVEDSPTSIDLKAGDYCLQVKGPLDGTAWAYASKPNLFGENK